MLFSQVASGQYTSAVQSVLKMLNNAFSARHGGKDCAAPSLSFHSGCPRRQRHGLRASPVARSQGNSSRRDGTTVLVCSFSPSSQLLIGQSPVPVAHTDWGRGRHRSKPILPYTHIDYPIASPPCIAPPLVSMPDRRSQQLQVSQLPPPTSSATTRRARVVETKSEKQLRLESQQGHDAEAKAERAA